MKRLSDILQGIEPVKIIGRENIPIGQITFDSREVKEKCLFIATRGTQVDGHDFIDKTIAQGADAVLCENLPARNHGNITYIQVEDAKKALGTAASNYYDNPSGKIKLVGVTGTNGKTTVVTLLYNLFQKLGYKSGLLSTVENLIDGTIVDATHTTPDAIQINRLLNDMAVKGCEFCFMEVSSHAIHQQRIAGLTFRGGIFTNITHDHLDYHHTFREYLEAKKMFFDHLPETAFALSNTDDKNGRVMLQNTRAGKKTYSLRSISDYKLRIMENHFDGMLLSIGGHELWTKFAGLFNAYNVLAVYGCALELGQPEQEVLKNISLLDPVRGRLEYFKNENGVTGIIDYAHTPDALLNVLNTINQIRNGSKQLITVIGAGGNRDKAKRPDMAKVSVINSTKVILTSDNPRDEDPEEIINDMRKGVPAEYTARVIAIANRKEAIHTACMLAQQGDIVLVAGKGHETYQEVKGTRYPFDDKEILQACLNL
ncbi:MAG: UDP-N-acetylmuramoyl-L-alanyl-D-glutamate--2,6-diaminopimelate ligase [Bacteroidetes bacterium]|jgi:UDP-N-acetylmuramoyl-L-alanyl-D-glutamate--2,6-diaminopimelate ligase|nr:UDP-N-acetylmuramoyl-L-alanyl-D-glutamate--2,6-diaminopimelate ligase [Bacteroidota bacterium]